MIATDSRNKSRMFIARLLRPVETKHTETPLTRAPVVSP
jgi:hypothetical protein